MRKKDPAHLAMVRTYPCVVEHKGLLFPQASGKDYIHLGATEVHHPTGGGMALKTPDSEAFPLCVRHHADFHALRGVFKGWTKERTHEWQKQMSDRFRPIDEVF